MTRKYEGRRLSMLSAMDNPVFFSYGLSIHGTGELLRLVPDKQSPGGATDERLRLC